MVIGIDMVFAVTTQDHTIPKRDKESEVFQYHVHIDVNTKKFWFKGDLHLIEDMVTFIKNKCHYYDSFIFVNPVNERNMLVNYTFMKIFENRFGTDVVMNPNFI